MGLLSIHEVINNREYIYDLKFLCNSYEKYTVKYSGSTIPPSRIITANVKELLGAVLSQCERLGIDAFLYVKAQFVKMEWMLQKNKMLLQGGALFGDNALKRYNDHVADLRNEHNTTQTISDEGQFWILAEYEYGKAYILNKTENSWNKKARNTLKKYLNKKYKNINWNAKSIERYEYRPNAINSILQAINTHLTHEVCIESEAIHTLEWKHFYNDVLLNISPTLLRSVQGGDVL